MFDAVRHQCRSDVRMRRTEPGCCQQSSSLVRLQTGQREERTRRVSSDRLEATENGEIEMLSFVCLC